MRISFGLLSLACVLVALPATAQQISLGEFNQRFSAAMKADDYAAQEQLVLNNADLVKDDFRLREHGWVETKLVGEPAAEAHKSIEAVMERLATLGRLSGRDRDTLLRRLEWLKRLTPEQLQKKKASRAAILEGLSGFNAEWNQRPKPVEKMKKRLPALVKAYELAAEATDKFWAVNTTVAITQIYEVIPDFFATAYWAKKGMSHGANAGHTREWLDAFNQKVILDRAMRAGSLRAEFIDIEKPLEEAKEEYQRLADAALRPAGEGGEGGEGAPAGGGLAEVPEGPLPNKHEGSLDWVELTDLKHTAIRKRDFLTPHYTDNLGWWWLKRTGLTNRSMNDASFLPGKNKIEKKDSKLTYFMEGSRRGIALKGVGAGRPKVVKIPVKYLDGRTTNLSFEMQLHPSTWKINDRAYRSSGQDTALLTRNLSVVKAEVRGVDIEIHDLDSNGVYNNYGIDAVVFGKGRNRVVKPLSNHMMFDGLMYEINIEPNGLTIRTRPYTGQLAVLRTSFNGKVAPQSIVCSGMGAEKDYCYDAMDAVDEPMWILPGNHQVVSGYILKGKGRRAETMFISPGQGSKPKIVQPATLAKWEFGANKEGKFRLTFKASEGRNRRGPTITVEGHTIAMKGNENEQYSRGFFGVLKPTVQVRKKGSARPSVREEMPAPTDADFTANKATDFLPGPLELRKPRGQVEVRLVAEYGPLGELESDWTLVGN